jgi:serine/threonine protein kinase
MRFDGNNIILSPDDDNYIVVDNEDFLLLPLSDDYEISKGASSNLFILNDPNGDAVDTIIKICKSPISQGQNKRTRRFGREITAFKRAKKHGLTQVINFIKNGTVEIDDEVFLYFIMEKADEDLASFLVRNRFDFTVNQKLTFCVSILNGIKQLHGVGIYHRDIKHDNILVVDGALKIGDLGLVRFQNEDFKQFDRPNEKVGPFGWLSPEATNKMLTQGKRLAYTYDCDINAGSDIFQLGKLFWYVFQGNLPIGQILIDDYEMDEDDIYPVIFSMLQYKKSRRPNIAALEALLAPLKIKYGV